MALSEEIYEGKAEVLKALSHPLRLKIAYNLAHQGCHNVSCIESHTGVSQSSISQHLGKLKAAGVVTAERSGHEVYYQVTDTKIARLLEVLFEGEEVDLCGV